MYKTPSHPFSSSPVFHNQSSKKHFPNRNETKMIIIYYLIIPWDPLNSHPINIHTTSIHVPVNAVCPFIFISSFHCAPFNNCVHFTLLLTVVVSVDALPSCCSACADYYLFTVVLMAWLGFCRPRNNFPFVNTNSHPNNKSRNVFS